MSSNEEQTSRMPHAWWNKDERKVGVGGGDDGRDCRGISSHRDHHSTTPQRENIQENYTTLIHIGIIMSC